MLDIVDPAGLEIVQCNDLRTVGDKPVTKMRADESGSARDERIFA